jgi:putative transposase
MRLFRRPGDYLAFITVLRQAMEKFPRIHLLSFCLMPSHFHLVVRPEDDGKLSHFMFWLTMTHVQRWRHARRLVGLGPLYQGRFKAFAVEEDDHLFAVLRYVERNPLCAKLVFRAEKWEWSSLHLRLHNREVASAILRPWPIDQPHDWLDWVNRPQTDREVAEIQESMRTNRPFGSSPWRSRVAKRLGIELNPRPRGRPGGWRKTDKR